MDRRTILTRFMHCFPLVLVTGLSNPLSAATKATDAMPDETFWSLVALIEGTGWHDDFTNLKKLEHRLSALTAKEVEAFFETLAQKLYALDTRQHYRSFSWFGGLSDTFLYTRLAVVAQGKEYYDSVVEDPRKFPARSTNWLEGLLYVAPTAYETITGAEMDRFTSVSFESFSNVEGWKR